MMRVLIGSSPVVGSSQRMTSGSVAMARASPTRLRMPPERSEGRIASMPGQVHQLQHLRHPLRPLLAGHLREVLAQRVRDVLAHRELSKSAEPWKTMATWRRTGRNSFSP